MMRIVLATAVLLLMVFSVPDPTSADGDGILIINEVMYDPLGDELNGEWIELLVVEGGPTDGWTLTDLDGHLFTLPSLNLPAQTYLLVRIGSGVDDSDYADGTVEVFMNASTPILNNGGDELLLEAEGGSYDFFSYGPASAVEYKPLNASWDGRNLTSAQNESLSLFPSGKTPDKPEDWVSMPPTPGKSNGDIQENEDNVLIEEVYYHSLRDNEYICIHNIGISPLDLTAWTLSDGEGMVSFPGGTIIDAKEQSCVTRNSTSYTEDTLREASFTYDRGDAERLDLRSGQVLLRNEGDSVILRTNYGRVVDALFWGDSQDTKLGWEGNPAPVTRMGAVARRRAENGQLVDTNTSGDWMGLREYGLGQSDFERETFSISGTVTSFYSPGISLDVLEESIQNSTASVLLNAYQFTSDALANELSDAISRGVNVRILVEGEPVSGVKSGELRILERLHAEGAEIRLLMEAQDGHKRYVFNHAKYAVIDDTSLLMSSENWGNNGYPTNAGGNRGWGVLVHDRLLAGHFRDVFFEDWNPQRRDSFELSDILEHLSVYVAEDEYEDTEQPFLERHITEGGVTVEAITGPDNALAEGAILEAIASAEKRIFVEQFIMSKVWSSYDQEIANPLLEGLVTAARRDCDVRVLLDSTWYNTLPGDPNDNDDTVQLLNDIAENQNLPIEAKLIDTPAHGLLKLHNKGMIIDGRKVLISSLNWNRHSFVRNREVGLVIDSENVGSYFEDIFARDWRDDITRPKAVIDGPSSALAGERIALSGLSSYDDMSISRFSWDVDSDGVEDSNDSEIRVVFYDPGTYNITLVVEDEWGNSDSTTVEIVVLVRDVSDVLVLVPVLGFISSVVVSVYHFRKRRTKGI